MADRDFYYEPWNYSPTITVHESEHVPQAIGILDQNGVMLHRVEKRIAFGFQPPEASKPKLPRKRR